MSNRSLWRNLDRFDQELLDTKSIGILADADGTLSEIQAEPGLAVVSEDITEALSSLSRIYPLVAVVSGRRAEGAEALVGVKEIIYLGNHGLEKRWAGNTEIRLSEGGKERADAARKELNNRLPEADGLFIEDKHAVVAIHYRLCMDKQAIGAVRALAVELAEKYGLSVQHGRRITEIRPAGADKGRAVIDLSREHNLKQVIYIGDDATDIDAFKALKADSLASVTLAVAADESPAEIKDNADYWVSSVAEVQKFLEWLIDRAKSLPDREGRT